MLERCLTACLYRCIRGSPVSTAREQLHAEVIPFIICPYKPRCPVQELSRQLSNKPQWMLVERNRRRCCCSAEPAFFPSLSVPGQRTVFVSFLISGARAPTGFFKGLAFLSLSLPETSSHFSPSVLCSCSFSTASKMGRLRTSAWVEGGAMSASCTIHA